MDNVAFKKWLQNFDVFHSKALVMGIINMTPDSFFSLSRHDEVNAVLKTAEKMIADGVDIIDIGGESTRPGSAQVDEKTEMERVIPVIDQLRKTFDVCLSIDTYKPQVMQAAIEVGANMINDVTGLSHPQSIELAKYYDIPVCMMHISGTLEDMSLPFQKQEKVMQKLLEFFNHRLTDLRNQGFPMENLILDPGIGFGKLSDENFSIIRDLEQLAQLGYPVLLGVSRKKFIGELLDNPVEERLFGSLAAQLAGFWNGCRVFRTHDVAATRDSLMVAQAIKKEK